MGSIVWTYVNNSSQVAELQHEINKLKNECVDCEVKLHNLDKFLQQKDSEINGLKKHVNHCQEANLRQYKDIEELKKINERQFKTIEKQDKEIVVQAHQIDALQREIEVLNEAVSFYRDSINQAVDSGLDALMYSPDMQEKTAQDDVPF